MRDLEPAEIADDSEAAVSLLVSQMVHYVSTSVGVQRTAADLALLEQRQSTAWTSEQAQAAPSRHRTPVGRTNPPPRARVGSLGAANNSARGERVAQPLRPTDKGSSSSRRHSAAGTIVADTDRAAGGARPVAKPRASAKTSSKPRGGRNGPSLRETAAASLSEAVAQPASIANLEVLGPHGGDPGVSAFGGCVGDAVIAGEDQAVRTLRKRLAQLSALRYETEREEKRERIERRAASVAGRLAMDMTLGGGGARTTVCGAASAGIAEERARLERTRLGIDAAERRASEPEARPFGCVMSGNDTVVTLPPAPPLHRVRSHPTPMRAPLPVATVTRLGARERSTTSSSFGAPLGTPTAVGPHVPHGVIRTALHLHRR